MPRAECAAFLAASLDGFIARPDGRLDWQDAIAAEDHGYGLFLASVDTILVGRTTWEVVQRFEPWPYEGKRVVVLSRAARRGDHGERFEAGAPGPILERLHAEGSRRVYADGGAVVSQLVAADLLDELTISVIPVVLGEGIRLIQTPLPERPLELVSTRAYPSGLVQLRYRPRR